MILIAISLSFRYRMEFYPLLDLAAFLGLFLMVRNRTLQRHVWLTPLFLSATILGIVVAHLSLVTTYPSLGWLFSGATH